MRTDALSRRRTIARVSQLSRTGHRKTEKKNNPRAQAVKVAAFHVGLWLVVGAYMAGGGYAFYRLEAGTQAARAEDQLRTLRALRDAHHNISALRGSRDNWTRMVDDYARSLSLGVAVLGIPVDAVLSGDAAAELRMRQATADAWDVPSSILFAFTIVTTIGYGHIVPTTQISKVFCMVYGLVGIPLTMLAIADMGKFIVEGAFSLFRFAKKACRTKKGEEEEEAGEESIAWAALFLVCAFLLYTFLTALLLPLWEDIHFFDSVYFSFITLTTIGLGDIVPKSDRYLLPTLMFLTIGLALTTMTIEVAAESFKKLHYMGMKLKKVGKAKIWFGGKSLLVEDLLSALGKQYGIPEEELRLLNLEEMVEAAISEKERGGRVGVGGQRFRRPIMPEDFAPFKGPYPERLPFVDDGVVRDLFAYYDEGPPPPIPNTPIPPP